MNRIYLKEETEQHLVIALEGRFDSLNYQVVDQEFSKILEGKKVEHLTLDVKDLEYLSSSVLRVFTKYIKMIPNQIQVLNCSEYIFSVFNMTGFTRIMDVHQPIRKISIEGCTLIGRGANGDVYRLTGDSIVKVFRGATPLKDLDRERKLSQEAFLAGIPTAISFDVVETNEGNLGIVYELIQADTLSDVIKNQPEKFDQLASQYVDIYRKIHSKQAKSDDFPSIKDIYLQYIDGSKDWYTKEETDKLLRLIDSVPDRKTLIHGDYHPHNIMYDSNGQLILIDMGDFAYGHPIFDFLATAATQVNLVELSPAFAEQHTGMPVEYITKLWKVLMKQYFDDKTDQEIQTIEKQIRLFAKLKAALAPAIARHVPAEIIQNSVDDAKNNLLPYVDELIGTINW